MTNNEKIHQILEYICTNYDHAIVDTDEIADKLNMALSEVNILARKIIQNGHAKDGGSNDSTTLDKGAVSILQTRATCNAYEEKEYLKKPDEKTSRHNINAKNVQVGNNYGNIHQSSSEDLNASTSTTQENHTFKKITIGIFITVIGGLLLWAIIEFIK